MADSRVAPPSSEEYAQFYAAYVRRVLHTDILATLREQEHAVTLRFGAVPPERESFRYGSEKWSVRQVLGHMVDAERIFGTRALAIARGERQSLPSFDENAYVENAPFENVALADLLAEFLIVRRGHSLMFGHLTADDWARKGAVNERPIALRALPFIMAGHVHHHLEILAARYGV
jgi:hypothetical protein